MLQNKYAEKIKSVEKNKLDEQRKKDLANSHFKFGNFSTNFQTNFQSDYQIKSPNSILNSNNLTIKDIEKNLRSHSYILGNHPVDYKSESKLRFSSPDLLDNAK